MKGGLLSQAGQLQEAEKLFRRVAEIPQRLPVKFPATPTHRHNLADSRYRLAAVLQATSRSAEAEAAYREANAIWKQLVADFPKDPRYRTQLSQSHSELLELVLSQGKHAEAAKLAVELPCIHPDNPEENRRAAAFLERCAGVATNDGSLSPSDRKAAAENYAKQAAELLAKAGKRSNSDDNTR
jgi:tetratricopeptide (TPR) repeat protein